MKRTVCVFAVGLALAATAAAQTKVAGAGQCGKVEKEYKIDVGDRPGHVFTIVQGKCTFTKGELAGVEIKEEFWTGFSEINVKTARARWTSWLVLANGDKVYGRGEGSIILKDGVPQSEEGKWTFNNGTGKFKGIKGKGSYKGTFADGVFTFENEGEYDVAK